MKLSEWKKVKRDILDAYYDLPPWVQNRISGVGRAVNSISNKIETKAPAGKEYARNQAKKAALKAANYIENIGKPKRRRGR